jgi:hypothetical protein
MNCTAMENFFGAANVKVEWAWAEIPDAPHLRVSSFFGL